MSNIPYFLIFLVLIAYKSKIYIFPLLCALFAYSNNIIEYFSFSSNERNYFNFILIMLALVNLIYNFPRLKAEFSKRNN